MSIDWDEHLGKAAIKGRAAAGLETIRPLVEDGPGRVVDNRDEAIAGLAEKVISLQADNKVLREDVDNIKNRIRKVC